MLFLYLVLGPALLIVVGGAIVGGIAAPFTRAGFATRLCRWATWAVAATTGATVCVAVALPTGRSSGYGPTCPDTTGTLASMFVGCALASVAAGVVVFAAATVEAVKGSATGGTYGRLLCAVLVPYVAVFAVIAATFCDYT